MNIGERDRRALILLGVAVAAILLYRLAPTGSDKSSGTVLADSDTVAASELRLAKLRRLSAQVPGKEDVLKKVKTELADREKGVLVADTPQQAQAQLFQIMRRVMRAQQPPIEIASTEIGPTHALDDNYGEVLSSVSFVCRIEDLVNLLTDLTNQKELIATYDLRIGAAHPKEKTMPVRLTVAGVVRRELIPDKKVTAQF